MFEFIETKLKQFVEIIITSLDQNKNKTMIGQDFETFKNQFDHNLVEIGKYMRIQFEKNQMEYQKKFTNIENRLYELESKMENLEEYYDYKLESMEQGHNHKLSMIFSTIQDIKVKLGR